MTEADRDLAARCAAAGLDTRHTAVLLMVARGVSRRVAARAMRVRVSTVAGMARRAALAISEHEGDYTARADAWLEARDLLECLANRLARSDHADQVIRPAALVLPDDLVDELAIDRLLEAAA